MDSRLEGIKKSRGHLGFIDPGNGDGLAELYLGARLDLWRAPISNVFDGEYRIGRWEAPSHLADQAMRLFFQGMVKA